MPWRSFSTKRFGGPASSDIFRNDFNTLASQVRKCWTPPTFAGSLARFWSETMSRRSIRMLIFVAALAALLAAAHVAADRTVPPLATRGTVPTTAARPTENDAEPDTGCDASAGGEVDELIADQPVDRTIATAMPMQWNETHNR